MTQGEEEERSAEFVVLAKRLATSSRSPKSSER